MNEHSYIRSIHKQLKKQTSAVDIWKINDNYAGGVPDTVYFGNKSVLWIEYKYIKQLPKRNTTVIDLTKPQQYLSLLQQQWLEEKHLKNIRTTVIVGSPEGSVIFPDLLWKTPITVKSFTTNAIDTCKIATYIIRQVLI